MFGSILSTTDTVAVLALLKECGAGKRLTSLIEGESLLNDGASMVLFIMSLGIVKGT
jgi:NhaP-type Na+/H+ or K+/H+ antiporter